MPPLHAEQLREYLRRRQVAELGGPFEIQPNGAGRGEQRFLLLAGGERYLLTCYDPAAQENARREAAGLRLGGGVGIGPALLFADEAATELGGPVVVSAVPEGAPLGDRPLTEEETQSWLFLLLTLHHLSPGAVSVPSDMSADVAAWWQRTQPAWEACRAAYAGKQHRALLDVLTRLQAIVGVRVETHRALWQGITRRPCHGDPVPSNLVRTGGRLVLVEWGGFGLGDPAMEVGRAAALSALSGELSPERYVTFVSEYLDGVRDLRDPSIEERLRVFASVLPLGLCFSLLRLLGQERALDAPARARYVEQVGRSLLWIQDTMGVEVGDVAPLLASLRTPA